MHKIPLMKDKVQQGSLATYCPRSGSEADGVAFSGRSFELLIYLTMTVIILSGLASYAPTVLKKRHPDEGRIC
jgi:hypothetical protein